MLARPGNYGWHNYIRNYSRRLNIVSEYKTIDLFNTLYKNLSTTRIKQDYRQKTLSHPRITHQAASTTRDIQRVANNVLSIPAQNNKEGFSSSSAASIGVVHSFFIALILAIMCGHQQLAIFVAPFFLRDGFASKGNNYIGFKTIWYIYISNMAILNQFDMQVCD